MGKITKYLNQLIIGNVFDNPEILEKYSVDRSIIKLKPKFVAFPESTGDIQKLLKFFNQIALREIPASVTVRGSGLDEGGADLTTGLVISTEKLNRMLEIDSRDRLVRVQAGITLKELNTALSVSGLTVPIGGRDAETIGGLIANCLCDSYYGKYGGIQNYVERIEVILSNGDCLQTNRLRKYALAKRAAEKTFEGSIYRKIAKLLKEEDKFLREFDFDNAGLSGYPGIAKVPKRETVDLMPLFFGSQGTLGVISEVILRAVPIRENVVRTVATFKDLSTAIKYMDEALALRPREMNLCDLKIIQAVRGSGKHLDGVFKKTEDGFAVYMVFDERKNMITRRLEKLHNEMPRSVKMIYDKPENQLALNEFENATINYLNNVKNGERVPILTDFYIPSVNLVNFTNDIKVLGEKLDLDLALFGSYANGIYSLRPLFDFKDKDTNKKIATFLRAGAYIIKRQGGTLAGGTPEGRVKAAATNNDMLDSTKNLYSEIKKIFDPNNILNPDIKLGADSRFTLTHFRDSEISGLVG
ncbi:FAD-binding oxidoreductase [Candidatus Saccharibacteria bacterium]|nr:FAD-binding oxidoreductase [Candidatus Saccharibacteria bacterium]